MPSLSCWRPMMLGIKSTPPSTPQSTPQSTPPYYIIDDIGYQGGLALEYPHLYKIRVTPFCQPSEFLHKRRKIISLVRGNNFQSALYFQGCHSIVRSKGGDIPRLSKKFPLKCKMQIRGKFSSMADTSLPSSRRTATSMQLPRSACCSACSNAKNVTNCARQASLTLAICF